MKQAFLDFSFSYFFGVFLKAENSCSRRGREWERGGVNGGYCWGGCGCFVGHLIVGSTSLKKFQTSLLAMWLSYSSGNELLYIELDVQYMFILDLICMQYLCVYIILWTMTQTVWSLTCLHSVNACICMHICLYFFCKIEWLPFSGGGGSSGRAFRSPFMIS